MRFVIQGALPLIAIYGLLALGFTIIYRSTGVLNFAQGAFVLLGGLIGFTLVDHGANALVALPIMLVIGFGIGWLFYFVVMRRMAGQPTWAAVLVTLGAGLFVLVGLSQLIWSSRPRSFNGDFGFAQTIYHLPGGVTVSTMQAVLVLAFLLADALLLAFYRFSRIGISMRAASQDHHLAAYRGIDIHLSFGLAWGLATALAMFVGFAHATQTQLDLAVPALALKAFPAAMVGGMDSIGGVLFGAIVVGTVESAITVYGNPIWGSVAPFLILLAVLVIRPWGLFGTPELIDRV